MENEKSFFGFTCMSRMSYSDNLSEINQKMGEVDNIMFGKYVPNDGCVAEMGMTWYLLKDEEIPRLEVFSDAFTLLNDEVVLRLIANLKEDMTPDMFSKMLIEQGFKDMSDNPLQK